MRAKKELKRERSRVNVTGWEGGKEETARKKRPEQKALQGCETTYIQTQKPNQLYL